MPTPTVLLVDDDPLLLDMLAYQLASEGYRILTTSDPNDAPDILKREGVDVLVSDVNMPAMSGLDLVSKVRVAFPGVARILLTGQTSSDVVVDAINRGQVFRYLKKPCEGPELREAVRGAVQLAASLRRTAAEEIASTRRAHTLDHVERLHPTIRHIARAEDGTYALPRLSALLGEVHRSPVILVLRELLAERESPAPPTATGLDGVEPSGSPVTMDRVAALPSSRGSVLPAPSARIGAAPLSSLGPEELRAFEESHTRDAWPVSQEQVSATMATTPIAAISEGRSSVRSARIFTTAARIAAVAAPEHGHTERETMPDRPRTHPGEATTPMAARGVALAAAPLSVRAMAASVGRVSMRSTSDIPPTLGRAQPPSPPLPPLRSMTPIQPMPASRGMTPSHSVQAIRSMTPSQRVPGAPPSQPLQAVRSMTPSQPLPATRTATPAQPLSAQASSPDSEPLSSRDRQTPAEPASVRRIALAPPPSVRERDTPAEPASVRRAALAALEVPAAAPSSPNRAPTDATSPRRVLTDPVFPRRESPVESVMGEGLTSSQTSPRLDPALLSVVTPLRGTETSRRTPPQVSQAPLVSAPPPAAAALLARASYPVVALVVVVILAVALLLLWGR